MKVSLIIVSLFSLAAASPSISNGRRSVAAHAAIARRHAASQFNPNNPPIKKKRSSTKCKPKSTSVAPASTPVANVQSKPDSTPKPAASPAAAKPSPKPASSSSKAPAATPKSSPAPSSSNNNNAGTTPVNVSGLLKVQVARCGPNGAQKNTDATHGPNGDISFLNCGVNGGGWNPPYMTLDDIITVDLNDAIKQPNSPFQACSPYLWAFEQFGNQYGINPIILASFALQESSCNPQTTGGAGEAGLMQLTADKCGGAPGGNCYDVGYNVATGAKYFSDTYNGNNKDLLKSIGEYNGWHVGMTVGDATAAANTGCCRCQNNLDYLFQFLNGWVLNIDAYSHTPRLGQYFNLDKCGN